MLSLLSSSTTTTLMAKIIKLFVTN